MPIRWLSAAPLVRLGAALLACVLALASAPATAFDPSASAASAAAATPAAAPTADSGSAAALRYRFDSLHDTLQRNAFGRPLALSSTQGSDRLEGDITARLDYPFPALVQVLDGVDRWCDVLLLHLNTKQCTGSGNVLRLRVGRKWNQAPQDAYPLSFVYHPEASTPDYLRIGLTAADGPMGTRDYHIVVEATPLDDRHTILRLRYDYGFGTFARLAMQGYLGTVGRAKVGFTVVGRGADGQPEYVGGVRGLVERNTMRYFLAIEAVLASEGLPPAVRTEQRLETWFDATERYPRQLHELERPEYLAIKHDELRRGGAPDAVK